ncbi:MAG: NAD(P)/FAD-dependent oxidoreductase [Thermoleophilia bacterium]
MRAFRREIPVDPWPEEPPSELALSALKDAAPVSFWVDALPPRPREAALSGPIEADLCIVGGGFTGLWAAVKAKEDDPGREVVLLESESVGEGPSGRNGGFVDASITHGTDHALTRFPDEAEILVRLGVENFRGFFADLETYGIDADLERTGVLVPSLAPHQDAWLDEGAALARRFGHEAEVFADAAAVQAEVASLMYRAGLWIRDSSALVDPAKLALGLLSVAMRRGVRVYEGTAAVRIEESGAGLIVETPEGSVAARGVLVATGAHPPLARSLRRYLAPVYDYALMTEPLSPGQLASLGWRHRQGIADAGNQFHYYRLSKDDRILWGGYDAVYRFGGPVRPDLDQSPEVFGRLAHHFFRTFPQLEGVRFSHSWGGPIDTCSRFSVFFGRLFGGRAVYAAGYTGLGVGATRFGAHVALDLLDGRETEATRTRFVATKPIPFPPEPLRSAVIQITRNRLAAADRHGGKRGAWLRLLDRLGLGFDS